VTETLVYRVTIPAPPERVFARFTDARLMREWIGVAVELDARPGGALRIDVNGRDVVRGEFLALEPPERLSFTWGWEGAGRPVGPGASIVEVRLAPSGAGTQLELRHALLPDAALDVHRAGWEHYVPRLVAAAAGTPPGADPMATPATAHGGTDA